MKIRSMGALVTACVLALLGGLLAPFSYVLAFSGLFMLTPVLIPVLYAWAGWVPAAVLAISTAASAASMGGAGFVAIALLTLVLPGLVIVIVMNKRIAYTKAAAISVAAQLAALILAVIVLWLTFRTDLATVFTEWFRSVFKSLNATDVNQYLIWMGQMGAFGINESAKYANLTFLSVAQRVDLIEKIVGDLSQTLRLMLPARILTGSIITGGVGYVWANWICVRRGDEPSHPYVPTQTWRLPANAIIGLPVSALVSYILLYTGMSGAEGLCNAFLELTYLAFVFQGVGAMARRLKLGGMSRRGRFGLILVSLMFGQFIMRWIGVYSALFGSEGLISKRIRKHTDGEDREE